MKLIHIAFFPPMCLLSLRPDRLPTYIDHKNDFLLHSSQTVSHKRIATPHSFERHTPWQIGSSRNENFLPIFHSTPLLNVPLYRYIHYTLFQKTSFRFCASAETLNLLTIYLAWENVLYAVVTGKERGKKIGWCCK